MSNRQEYNKLQAAVRRQQAETLRRFREANPERYAELLAKAKTEVEQEESQPRLPRRTYTPTYTTTAHNPLETARQSARIDNILYKPQERHYFVYTKSDWDTSRLYCESFIPTPTLEEVLDELHRRHPKFSGTITELEPCYCPACLRRHP